MAADVARDVFVLGSGFSKAASQSMPLIKDLKDPLLDFLRAEHPEALAADALPIPEIEPWFDYLANSQPFLSEPDNLRNRALFGDVAMWLRRHLFDCQKHALGSPPKAWLSRLLDAWHRNEAVVITLNYDTLIESTVMSMKLEVSNKRVLPPDVYGFPVAPAAGMYGGAGHPTPSTISTLRLLKLHGSLSWYYPGVPGFGQPILDIRLWDAWEREERTSRSEAEDRAAGFVPFIIPPTFTKTVYFEHQLPRRLWELAARAVSSARRIYCLGYSLPSGDGPVRNLLSTCGSGRDVIVVNLSEQAPTHYESLLPAATVATDRAFAGGEDVVEAFAMEYAAATE